MSYTSLSLALKPYNFTFPVSEITPPPPSNKLCIGSPEFRFQVEIMIASGSDPRENPEYSPLCWYINIEQQQKDDTFGYIFF